ncbi:FAD-dependent oxidoreductase [Streptomyces sp. CBMA156]|uniref:FAD-dependent oxidoreductase n=1 Tax=Streptomyces sp. CBMA156 TaxID=1930280 RepID=UPI0016621B4D|nr:FAD-dependent monooxygenase [Streptomyces sp. CBMA156]MBD0670554.1 hypothetical protein [Streptomyces sp. CBMA156]MBD0676472.1 hypothetical protein [Streptomyces sp. CBMA156]
MSPRILIVGAGPVGLSAAISLRLQGLPVTVVDKAAAPHTHPKAVVLWPRALESFERLGVADRLVAEGHRLTGQQYHSNGTRVASMTFRRLRHTKYPFALAIPQHTTERVLRDRLSELGGSIRTHTELTALRQDVDTVTATLTDLGTGAAQEEAHDWVIGADGVHSSVRSAIGVEFVGQTYEQTFLLSDGPCDTGLSTDSAHYFMTDTGVLVMVPLPNEQWRAFISAPREIPEGEALVDTVARVVDQRSPVPVRFLDGHTAGRFRIHRKAAEQVWRDRVFLVGDAAHAHSPAGGQGINTGVEDATSLAWRLGAICRNPRSAAESGRVFTQWADERHQVVENVLRDTDLQTRLWGVRGLRRRLRDAVLYGAERTGLLDRMVIPRQTQIAQRFSPGPGQGRPKAVGVLRSHARLPNVAIPTDTVGGTRLHDFLSLTEPIAIEFDPAGTAGRHSKVRQSVAQGAGLDVVSLTGPALRSALGISRRVTCVVRPDGIVAELAPKTARNRGDSTR